MDFWEALRELQRERDSLTAVIRTLEGLVERDEPGVSKSRRGRKNMLPAERAEVSTRMKKYWAARRRNSD